MGGEGGGEEDRLLEVRLAQYHQQFEKKLFDNSHITDKEWNNMRKLHSLMNRLINK